jgi:hypothetical protein
MSRVVESILSSCQATVSAFAVAIGGKADMTCCSANVRLRPKADTVRLPYNLLNRADNKMVCC